MFDLNGLVRENIKRLVPYASAREEFMGTADVYLDANENPFGSPVGGELNRYPDPLQTELKARVADSTGLRAGQIFIGNGSDEAIDLLFRIFCEPRTDLVVVCPPTYGMYKVAADINDVGVTEVPLTSQFQLDITGIQNGVRPNTKLIFICSPNNPTGNVMRRSDILAIAEMFSGIVVVDEAYIHFSSQRSLVDDIDTFPNLVVLQTFSKAWGLAGARVGIAFANEQVIDLFNRTKPPYNVSRMSQKTVIDALDHEPKVRSWAERIIEQREALHKSLTGLGIVEIVYPSEANFLLVKMRDADAVYRFLLTERIAARNRSSVILCEQCLRLTVGTPNENRRLLDALTKYETQASVGKVQLTRMI